MKSSSADCISSHNPPLAFVGYDLAISWRVLLSTVKSRGGHGTMTSVGEDILMAPQVICAQSVNQPCREERTGSPAPIHRH